ncbi:hypothetical protein BU26DRAFT_50874 [Trematosphaeria pertusa]|uniref:Uncharacterized protein n=1 Tax=Trematosphaeria pertusa TaxID=390896 RepID=A0A6A6IAZ4_9PLEO|nr:uncharacterized protein BU26DRAFT_50874 [Trematosphaeria pertusa]KAF2246663.1 hypothetical protein BU26DRAFT_50874 [Trematosphaeria pertusa]
MERIAGPEKRMPSGVERGIVQRNHFFRMTSKRECDVCLSMTSLNSPCASREQSLKASSVHPGASTSHVLQQLEPSRTRSATRVSTAPSARLISDKAFAQRQRRWPKKENCRILPSFTSKFTRSRHKPAYPVLPQKGRSECSAANALRVIPTQTLIGGFGERARKCSRKL